VLDTTYAFRNTTRQGLSCSRYSTLERDSLSQQYFQDTYGGTKDVDFHMPPYRLIGATGSWNVGNRNVAGHGL